MLATSWTFFFFSSRRRHTRLVSDWSSDVCSSDLNLIGFRNRYDIACLDKRVRLRFSAQSIVQTEADEPALIASTGSALTHFCLRTANDIDGLAGLV